MTLALLILTVLAMVAVAVLFKGNPGVGRPLQIVLCVVVLALAVMRIGGGDNHKTGAELSGELHEIVGWGLGEQLSEDLPSGGNVLVLVPPILSPGSERANQALLRGLKKGARSSIELQHYQLGRNTVTEDSMLQATSVAEDALGALKEGTVYAAAVVFSPVSLEAWAAQEGPPLYLYDAFGSRSWEPFLAEGTVKAVVHKQDAPKISEVVSGRLSLRSGFDAVYQLVTE